MRHGCWTLTAALAFVFSGCGESPTTEGQVDQPAEQLQAQQNMIEFMKTKGKGGKKAAN